MFQTNWQSKVGRRLKSLCHEIEMIWKWSMHCLIRLRWPVSGLCTVSRDWDDLKVVCTVSWDWDILKVVYALSHEIKMTWKWSMCCLVRLRWPESGLCSMHYLMRLKLPEVVCTVIWDSDDLKVVYALSHEIEMTWKWSMHCLMRLRWPESGLCTVSWDWDE